MKIEFTREQRITNALMINAYSVNDLGLLQDPNAHRYTTNGQSLDLGVIPRNQSKSSYSRSSRGGASSNSGSCTDTNSHGGEASGLDSTSDTSMSSHGGFH